MGSVVYASLVVLYQSIVWVVWYTSVWFYYIKVLCGECGKRQSSYILLKYCVGKSVVYVSLVVLY